MCACVVVGATRVGIPPSFLSPAPANAHMKAHLAFQHLPMPEESTVGRETGNHVAALAILIHSPAVMEIITSLPAFVQMYIGPM